MLARRDSVSIPVRNTKPSRAFGTDLTNLTITQPKNKPISCLTARQNHEHVPLKNYQHVKRHSMLREVTRDPLQDYETDIRKYVIGKVRRANEDYFEWQLQIDEQQRQNLVTVLSDMQTTLHLKLESLHLAVAILDQYCYYKHVSLEKYKTIGIACLFIASKYCEITIPKMLRFIQSSNLAVTGTQLFRSENEILQTIDFQINTIVPTRQICLMRLHDLLPTLNHQRKEVFNISEYILELALMSYELSLVSQEYLGTVIAYISCKMKNVQGISSKQVISKFKLEEPTFKDYFYKIVKMYKHRGHTKFGAINKKYNMHDYF